MLRLRRTPPPLLLGAAVLAPLLLAGCEKPSPSVTIFAGSDSERAEAACWSHDEDEAVVQTECGGAATDIPVGAGDVLGISVDKDVHEGSGWQVVINDQPVSQEPLTTSHYKVPVQQGLGGQEYSLKVYALDESGQQPRGVWNFRLVPDDVDDEA